MLIHYKNCPLHFFKKLCKKATDLNNFAVCNILRKHETVKFPTLHIKYWRTILVRTKNWISKIFNSNFYSTTDFQTFQNNHHFKTVDYGTSQAYIIASVQINLILPELQHHLVHKWTAVLGGQADWYKLHASVCALWTLAVTWANQWH